MTKNNGEFKGYTKASIEFLEKRFDEFQLQLNRRFSDVEREVQELKTNHIAHLQERLDKIEASLSWNRLWLIGILGTALLSAIMELVKNR